MSILITSVLNYASDRLAISSSLSCIFSGALICSFIWAFFFLSRHTWNVVRGGALVIHQGGSTHVAALWCCMWGRGPRGNNAACSNFCQFSVTSPATHNQIGPFWCWFPGEWVCVRSRTLWVSPTNSSVRLEGSPAAATPTEVCSQRFEASFPSAGALGCAVCLAPQLFLLVYLSTNVGLPSLQCAASLGPPATTLLRVLSACLHSSYWSGWMFLL